MIDADTNRKNDKRVCKDQSVFSYRVFSRQELSITDVFKITLINCSPTLDFLYKFLFGTIGESHTYVNVYPFT